MLCILLTSIYVAIRNVFFLTGFLSSENSFPQVLSPEEERKYLDMLKEGNEEARNVLITRNLRLVARIGKKFLSTGIDFDDLISIGSIGLIKGVSTFDAARGNKLSTYVSRCIENEILMFVRKNAKVKSEISLHKSLSLEDDTSETTLIDMLEDHSETIAEKVELNIMMKKLYNLFKTVLKGREKSIIEHRYGLLDGMGKTQNEIANMLGISRSYVSRIESRALEKLKRAFEAESL